MSQQARPLLELSAQAVGAVSYARAVQVAAAPLQGAIGASQATAAAQKVIGIARRDAASGAFLDMTCLGTAIWEAGAAVPVGSVVMADASGRCIVATAPAIAAGTNVGTNLQAAAAAGDLIEVLIGA